MLKRGCRKTRLA